MGKIISTTEIGKKLRRFRLDAKLTQERLAEILNISFQQVQKYERGVTKINLTRLQQIADALQVSVSDFFEDNPQSRYNLSDNEIKLLTTFREINNTELQNSLVCIIENLAGKTPFK